MGMNIGAYGIKPKTKEYEQKLQIYNLCKEQKVEIPEEIINFFDGDPCKEGILVKLDDIEGALEYPEEDDCEIIQVDISKLPKEIKKIRFQIWW